jgi:hypothetical protein
MPDRENVIKELKDIRDSIATGQINGTYKMGVTINDALELLKSQRETIDELISADKLLKEQDELLKHEYWRGYNNGRADERGLQEGTIMQTFSPD